MAAAHSETFPIVLSASPLIRQGALPTGKPKPVVRYASEAAMFAAAARPDPLAAEQLRLSEFYTIVKGRTTLLSLPDSTLRAVFQFCGATLKDLLPLTRVCKRFSYVTFDLETNVTLIPSLVTVESLSKTGTMASLAKHLGKNTRGPHIESLSIIDSKTVFTLSRQTIGPVISKLGLQSVLVHTPALVQLDVRGVVFRDHSPITDHFLADLVTLCPKLEVLKIGAALARCWDPQWWSKMHQMTEFVVGSRREDADWSDPSPLQLHEDVFAMLRSTAHKWRAAKFWCALHSASFQQLVSPAAPFAELRHLSINAVGNTSFKPLEDLSNVADTTGADKKKADAKGKKGAAEENVGPKFAFPVLESFCVADVHERPEFASELAAKLTLLAPQFTYFNVTNTHRNAPTKAPPATGKAKRV